MFGNVIAAFDWGSDWLNECPLSTSRIAATGTWTRSSQFRSRKTCSMVRVRQAEIAPADNCEKQSRFS